MERTGGLKRTAALRIRKLGSEVFEALTFAAAMLAALLIVFRTTGPTFLLLAGALVIIGVAAAWRWRRWGPIVGASLIFAPVCLFWLTMTPGVD